MRNWRYDERGGMVAVYEGEPKNCLSLPDGSFIFARYWERTEKGFAVVEDDKTVARLIAAAPRLFDALAEGSVKDGYPIKVQRVLALAVEALHSSNHHTLATELEAVRLKQEQAMAESHD